MSGCQWPRLPLFVGTTAHSVGPHSLTLQTTGKMETQVIKRKAGLIYSLLAFFGRVISAGYEWGAKAFPLVLLRVKLSSLQQPCPACPVYKGLGWVGLDWLSTINLSSFFLPIVHVKNCFLMIFCQAAIKRHSKKPKRDHRNHFHLSIGRTTKEDPIPFSCLTSLKFFHCLCSTVLVHFQTFEFEICQMVKYSELGLFILRPMFSTPHSG